MSAIGLRDRERLDPSAVADFHIMHRAVKRGMTDNNVIMRKYCREAVDLQ